MLYSLTETLKKINQEISNTAVISITISLLIIIIFFGFKIYQAAHLNQHLKINYIKHKSSTSSEVLSVIGQNISEKFFIYASRRGKKYYFYNCKSSILEENRIYFHTEQDAKDSGYVLSQGCQ